MSESARETKEDMLARYRELANDPVAKAVANMIQPNRSSAFDEEKGIEMMRQQSERFGTLVSSSFSKVNISPR